MAEVFKAKSRSLGGFEKILAIKRLHAKFCEDREFIRMLIEEARIAVQLNHINIGQIFDLEQIGENYFICMEYIDGPDLYKILKKSDEQGYLIPIEAATFLTMEICHGLDYAHRKKDERNRPLKIVHRDISPQNIIISYEGEVKIVDFGIAKAAQRNYDTDIGIIKGKFYYMSPEQAQGDFIDNRTDIFSAGIVLYEMLTGTLLYRSDDDASLLSRVRRAHFEPPRAIRSDIPRELERIVLRALARSPDHRYGSALEMGSALQSFLFTIGSQYNKARLGGFLRELFGREDGAPPPTRSAGSMSRGELQPSPSSLLRVAEEQQAQTWENDHPPVRSGKAAVQPAVPGGQVTEGAGGWGRSPTRRSPAPAAKSGPLPLGRLSFSSPGRAAPAAVPVPSPWPSPRPEQREGRPGGELSPEPKSAPGGYMAAANQREGTRQQQGQGRTATGPPAGPARSPLDDLADGWPAPPPLPPVGEPGWGWDMAPTLLPTIEDPPQVAPPAAPHSPAEDVDEDDETTVYLGAEKPRSIPAAPVADDPTHDEALLLMSEAPTVEHAEGVPAFHAGLLVDEATQRPRQAAPVHGEMHEDRPWPALVVAEERGGWQQPFAGLGNRPLQAGGTPSSRQVLTFLAALAGILTSGWLISFCSHSVLLRPGLAFDFQRNEVVTRPVETAGAVTGWPAGRAPTAAPAPAEQPAFLPSAQPGAAAPTARPEVGAARPEIGATRLEIVSRPLGAQVEVNGKPLPGVTPLTVVLEPGRYHDLGIELAHHQPWSSRLVLETGEQRLLSIKLEPILGQLEVHSRPAGAEVLIDDLPVGVTPLQLQELPISDNPTLVLRRSGFQELRTTVEWKGRTRIVLDLELTALRAPISRPSAPAAAVRRPAQARPASPPAQRTPAPAFWAQPPARALAPPSAFQPAPQPAPTAGVGYLTVHAIPWGKVVLDGQEIAPETPMLRRPVPAGRHLVQVYFPSLGQQSPARLVELAPGQETKLLFGRE